MQINIVQYQCSWSKLVPVSWQEISCSLFYSLVLAIPMTYRSSNIKFRILIYDEFAYKFSEIILIFGACILYEPIILCAK
jgi:hypothetical protein